MKRIAIFSIILAASATANEVPTHLQLKTETVNAVLQYLGTQPYLETAGLIQRIQQESTEYVASLNAKKTEAEAKKK